MRLLQRWNPEQHKKVSAVLLFLSLGTVFFSVRSQGRARSVPRNQKPRITRGFVDTKRRLRNIFMLVRIQSESKRTLVSSDARRARELNPSGCKPLDVSQTPSSTHWQHPPKRSSAIARFYGAIGASNEFGSTFFVRQFHFGTKQKRHGLSRAFHFFCFL